MSERKWWQEKVAYQIWPKSFYDTNGDGIGDLQGIIAKLDYLKELGVDIIWISPCYPSPMADQGYDIADYRDIHPDFGTMADMDELLAEAKKRDMYIILDLVANHCSDEHEWFKKACQDPDGEYGKYFYITDTPKDGSLPNNWRSIFGGSVWEPLPGHPEKMYLHTYVPKQPDLNWENPKVRQELYDMINWWLDKGVAGFRLDAIINIKKTSIDKSYPSDRPDGLCNIRATMLAEAVGIDDFLQELKRETFAKHDAFTVGEVFTSRPDALQAFIGENGHFSTMFDFDELEYKTWRDVGYDAAAEYLWGEEYKQVVFHKQKQLEGVGYVANILENHDRPRAATHFLPKGNTSIAAKKLIGAQNFMLRGIPFIYQGQEIGMVNTVIDSMDMVDDCQTKDNYKVCLSEGYTPEAALAKAAVFSRDNARTPVQWSAEENAGFTTGTPWMKVNPTYKEINVADQENDPDSVLNWYRSLTALRHDPKYKEAICFGDLIPYKEEQLNLMSYYRKTPEQTLLVVSNYQPEPQDVELPGEAKAILLNNLKAYDLEGNILHMKGFQFVMLEL